MILFYFDPFFFFNLLIDDNTYNEAVKFLRNWFMLSLCEIEIV